MGGIDAREPCREEAAVFWRAVALQIDVGQMKPDRMKKTSTPSRARFSKPAASGGRVQ